MDIPFLKPAATKRPRPEDDRVFHQAVIHRFTRANGVFAMLRRALEKSGERATSVDITASYKKDCLEEIFDAMASDAYHAFFERENGICYRLEPQAILSGGEIERWTLHAMHADVVATWEQKCLERYSRREMEHALPFGIAVIQVAVANHIRAKSATSIYDPQQLQEMEARSLRAIMMCFPYRKHLETQHQILFGFLLPYRLRMVRLTARGVAAEPQTVFDVGTQLRSERGERLVSQS